MRSVCHIAAVLALLLLPVGSHAEEEKRGTACTYPALIADVDDGLQAIYEGIRLGLEKAALPRVCLEEAPGSKDAWSAFERKWAPREADRQPGERPPIVFGLGDSVVKALRPRMPDLPKVFAVERLATRGEPIPSPPPIASRQALVVAQLDAERVGRIWARLVGGPPKTQIYKPPPGSMGPGPSLFFDFPLTAGARIDAEKPNLVVHSRWYGPSFAEALTQSRALRLPLVSDDRARFGQGATVVIFPDYGQVGRVAADLARRLDAGEALKKPVRTLSGLRVWVDLEAADRAGVELPLAFLATADRLRPGIRKRSK